MNELFGGLFDFDRNGETDSIELALGFEIMSQADEENESDEDIW